MIKIFILYVSATAHGQPAEIGRFYGLAECQAAQVALERLQESWHGSAFTRCALKDEQP
jgi:hypothetical protein